jgi:hypothetical protein
MSNIDNKLLERFQMFEEIDKMVKKETKSNLVDTGAYKNKNFNNRMSGMQKAESNPNLMNTKNSNLNLTSKGTANPLEGRNMTRGQIHRDSESLRNNNSSNKNPNNNDKQHIDHSFSNNFNQNYYSNQNYNNRGIDMNVMNARELSQNNIGLNKANLGPSSDDVHYNQIYLMNNNKKETGKVDKNKMSKTSFNSNSSQSSTFYNINKKINSVDPQETGERLYKNAFQIKGKIEKMRYDEEQKRRRSRTPEISPGAKKIVRDPTKFPERLYPSHKVKSSNAVNSANFNIANNAQEVQIINTVLDVGFLKNLEKNSECESKPINHAYNFDDKSENNYHDIDKEENQNDNENYVNPNDRSGMVSDNDSNLNKIYRKNKDKSDHYNFEYKPKLNKNSLKIAEQLQPSKERLVSKKKRSTSRSPSRTPNKNNNAAYNFSYLSDDGFVPNPNKKRSKSPAPSNRIKELYMKGLEQRKKLETLHDQKKKLEQEEYKNFSYKPKIISNSPVLISKYHSNERFNKSSENMTKDEKQKYDMYEKQMNWKKNIENNNKRLKKNFDDEKYKNLPFKPVIHNKIAENDEKFIMKNLGQIEEYVNRRRSNIQKQKEDEEYKKKIFPNGENFKFKPTIAKEFKFKTDERSRSRSKDGNRSREHSNNSPRNVKMMRKKIKAKDFFENPNSEAVNERYSESNNSQNKNNYYSFNDGAACEESSGFAVEEDEKVAFVNAINNLHSKLVNFKF